MVIVRVKNKRRFAYRALSILLLGMVFEISAGLTAIKPVNADAVFAGKEVYSSIKVSQRYLFDYAKDTTILSTFGFAPGEAPEYTTDIYRDRINGLSTALPLVYNDYVQGYMNLYLKRKRGLTSRIIGRSYDYFPLFEKVLKEKGLPDELKYLAVIESALTTEATSWCGAAGLWQFMPATGEMYDLTIVNGFDQRRDPELSTIAAAEFLSHLHKNYNDWLLAIAAYNCGPGNVNKALKKARRKRMGTDFWSIMKFLPKETQGYVPGFIAAAYFMNYYHQHNLKAIDPKLYSAQMDSVEVTGKVVFAKASKYLNITPEELCFLNPDYDSKAVINPKDKPAYIKLPVNLMPLFRENEQLIYSDSRD